jgi:quinol monooxygenase YgiN
MIYLLAHLKCHSGAHPELMSAAKAMIAATRTEPGCILYDLNISITDPQSMIFVEAWESREALSEHFETPHMAVSRRASERYFTERKIEIIHPEKVEVS